MSIGDIQNLHRQNEQIAPATYEIPKIVPGTFQSKILGVGFSGAHRTGKTVTAMKVADTIGIPYIKASVSSSDVWTTIRPSDTMTFGERMQIQEILLYEMEGLLNRIVSNNNAFVIDRTPIDVLAYLLTNIDSTTSSIFDSRGKEFIDKCIDLSAKFFSYFVVIPPGIPFVGDTNKNGKTYNSKIYLESLTDVIIGAYCRYFERLSSSIQKTLIVVPDRLTKLEDRVDFITISITKFL